MSLGLGGCWEESRWLLGKGRVGACLCNLATVPSGKGEAAAGPAPGPGFTRGTGLGALSRSKASENDGPKTCLERISLYFDKAKR